MRCEILSSIAEYGRADSGTGSVGQFVFDGSCSFCSGGLGFVVTDEDGLGGLEFAITDDILAVSVFIGCGNEQ